MATTYVALDSQTVTSAVSSITFSSIPQTYTDLVVVVQAATSSNTPLYMKPNSSSSSVYSTSWVLSNGTTESSSRYNQAALGGAGILIDNYGGTTGFPSGLSGMAKYEIMNYSNTTTFKTILIRAGSAASWTVASANLFASTTAISSLYFYPYTGNFAVGSTFTLYGVGSVVAASAAKATGGDTIATDGTYWYHAFKESGTFTPTSTLTCDILTIAGGGGGADVGYAGGGAGGLVYSTSQSISATAQTVTVGGGGAVSTNGSNSSFAAITATGGGRAAESFGVGIAGGSGGGGSGASAGGAASPAGQGFAGGAGSGAGYGGGGGGAGGAGADATGGGAGAGGAGTSAYSAWASVTGTGVSGVYCRGGNTGTSIFPNSGFGATAQDLGATGAASSGLVIVRYAV
jgi:hypothetical protein